MDENYNSDPGIKKDVKTSTADEKGTDKTTGDSQAQTGNNVESHSEKAYEKSDEAQEYIFDINNNTKEANTNPADLGKNN